MKELLDCKHREPVWIDGEKCRTSCDVFICPRILPVSLLSPIGSLASALVFLLYSVAIYLIKAFGWGGSDQVLLSTAGRVVTSSLWNNPDELLEVEVLFVTI